MSESNPPVGSPCISVCALNDDDVCMGCYRTADEITRWVLLDRQERIHVLECAAQRRRKENPFA